MRTCPGAPDDPDQSGRERGRSWLIPGVEENGIDPDERARPLHRPIRETAAPDVQGSSSCPMAATLLAFRVVALAILLAVSR